MNERNYSQEVLLIEEAVKDYIESLNYKIVELLFVNNSEITIFLYKEDGVKVNDLGTINKALYKKLEALPLLAEGFTLEISSPGIFRKLKYYDEFELFKEKSIKLIDQEGKLYKGISKGFKDNVLILQTDKDNTVEINRENIKKASLNG